MKGVIPQVRWSAEEIEMLRDAARRLSPEADAIALRWTEDLLADVGKPLATSCEAVKRVVELNRWFLANHLSTLRDGDLDTVLRTNFEGDLALLRAQRGTDPELRSTLSQLFLSLATSTRVILDRLRVLYEHDPRLPAVLTTWSRLALFLGEVVGQAYHEARSEEMRQALRISASLLEASRQLNTRAASVAAVLSHLTGIVNRLVPCDKSLVFLWRDAEEAYVAEAGHGFPETDLAEIRSFRFRRGDFPMMDTIFDGGVASGTLDDGNVPRDMMERFGEAVYAVAPMHASDGRRLGTLAAYRKEPSPFDATDVGILEGVAQNAALAIENAMLVEKLEAASRLKTAFINSVSHEIRTPINVMMGYLEMLADRRAGDEADLQIICRVRESTGYLLKLVNTILDVGRMETGRVPLRIETFSAEDLLEALREMFATTIACRRIAFSCRATTELPLITTDRMKLVEVLSNLVANAFKFTDRGCVTVEASALDEAVVFVVRDTGIGIDQKLLGDIFDVFRQVGPTDRGGTGLGLYIVKRLTTLLGGEVGVESEPGKGSTFRVVVPTMLSERSPAPAPI